MQTAPYLNNIFIEVELEGRLQVKIIDIRTMDQNRQALVAPWCFAKKSKRRRVDHCSFVFNDH